jgi:phage terminase large subunit
VSLVRVAAETIRRWRTNTAAFAREACKYEPDKWQLEAFRAWDAPIDTADPRSQRVLLQACAGPGKSRVLGTMGWQTLLCRGGPGAHPNGYAISITGENLSDNLWKELAVIRNGSEILQQAFEWTAEKIYARDHPETWWLKARSYAKSADPESQGNALSGLHARNIFYLVDESGEMAPAVIRKAEQGLSNCEWGKIAQAGNPTSVSGALYHGAGTQAKMWTVIRISGDPDDPHRSPRIDINWARNQIKENGRDNPWVQVYILGNFPPGGLNTLLTPDQVRVAMGRNPGPDEFAWAQKRIGVDVARFGDDRTVIWPRQGVIAYRPAVMRKQRTDAITARVLLMQEKFQSELQFVDDTGHWGHGVVDNLLAAECGVQPVIFSDEAIDPRYYNRRAEMWFRMADHIKKGLALPNMPELIPELTEPRYGFKGGKMIIEEKDQLKKRLGYSPDLADALALTYAWPDMPKAEVEAAQRGTKAGRMAMEYDVHGDVGPS